MDIACDTVIYKILGYGNNKRWKTEKTNKGLEHELT